MPPYEVRCPSCNVSFPPETRRCLHCGERTVRPHADEAEVRVHTAAGGATSLEAAEDEAELTPQRLPLRIMSLVWVALALVASFWRVCTEGQAPPG